MIDGLWDLYSSPTYYFSCLFPTVISPVALPRVSLTYSRDEADRYTGYTTAGVGSLPITLTCKNVHCSTFNKTAP